MAPLLHRGHLPVRIARKEEVLSGIPAGLKPEITQRHDSEIWQYQEVKDTRIDTRSNAGRSVAEVVLQG
jgi:hypothetical protein